MTIFDAHDLIVRDLAANGDNATDYVIGNVHFNLTTLNHWNYTIFGNGTISNGSWCFLTFEPYVPQLLYPNGTFINGTWCYTPVKHIGVRGGVGVAFACLFGLSLVPTLINLAKHGKLYLPAEKRFYPIGRRWQWYWAILVAVAAMIGLFTGIDVDRYYIASLPIVLNSFFWFLLQMGAMALVWESVRHWGSWMERQYIDPNPFVLQQTDRRGMFELWLPIVFYMWLWLNFFLIVPRNWGNLELQRDPDQSAMFAEPTATDSRFKAATFCLLACWLTTLVSLWHSIRHYEERSRGLFNRVIGGLGYMPFRFVLMLPIALGLVAYQGLAAWDFSVSPLKQDTNFVAMYVGGYVPALLLIIILNVSGFMRPNEDKALIQQRRERGAAIDAEMGIARKPAWWRRVNGDRGASNMRDLIMRNVREVGGRNTNDQNVDAVVDRRAREADTTASPAPIEMNEMRRANSGTSSIRTARAPPPYTPYTGKSEARRTEVAMQAAAGFLFPNAAPPPSFSESVTTDEPRGRTSSQARASNVRPGTSERSNSTQSSQSLNGQPQQVRSMLDI
ncbi:hypothetical protein JX265_009450 [Neoarthrinium moseri]|uniref:Uncharacterized protein n=1 Tax=Neoarthrinium moseri TaxID=1658444 RepID=A0A9P9WFU1_9PEZI|nr:uncharacterized protein JN550_010717 [Neoarthrinium moseri]KAI1861483.1 hypothetical protein JX265_009450 [Neoarthrinium moseri]KAI1861777.1 hypothetical protein JN550_010717 [Neoarthrinium moseri]